MSVEELAAKFQDNASISLPNKIDAIIDAVIGLEQLGSVGELVGHAYRKMI
jgi:hypothetical protein